MKTGTMIIAILAAANLCAANELQQKFEKAYFLETAKGQTEEAMAIYRKIAATEASDENRDTVLEAMSRLQFLYKFPHILPFQTGITEFETGDAIEILEIRGTKKAFELGGTYAVRGTYTLQSKDEASLDFYITSSSREGTRVDPSQKMLIKKGSGKFELINTFRTKGWPHLSFSPTQGGSGFGNAYFGSGEWLRNKVFQKMNASATSDTDTIQKLVDAAQNGDTVLIPSGKHEGTIVIDKNIRLIGANRENCILEATADKPLIYVPKNRKVIIESLTLKSQLETSERTDPPGCALLAQDATVLATNCTFIALGNAKRSPVCVFARGFSTVQLEKCHFEGFEYTIQYGEGTEGLVKDCIIQNSGHCGISVFQDAEVTIENNIITGSLYHGIRSTGGTILVRDNLIINNRNRGIYLGSKPAHGNIRNNAIIGNRIGISAFSYTDTEIENNLILNSGYSGIDTRSTCKIRVKDNILWGNSRGFSVQEPQGSNKFKVVKNTFWKNEQNSVVFKLPSSTIEADPQFEDPTTGNFAVGNSTLQSAKQGLINPEPISKLWEKCVELVSNNTKALSDEIGTLMAASKEQEKSALQSKIDGFDMDDGDLKSVIRTFGEPKRYFWGDKTYKKNNRPNTYLISYPNGLRILMSNGGIEEFRLEKKADYSIAGITVGTPLDQVIDILGEPNRTVSGRECTYEENVLYQNSKGRPDGHVYYSTKGLRMFFMNEQVTALYITDNTILAGK